MSDKQQPYPIEVLSEDEDDGTMSEGLAALTEAVVGHRIVSVEEALPEDRYYGAPYFDHPPLIITLDNGKRVEMLGGDDCCAYTEVEEFLLHPDRVDHIITGVGTTGNYSTWHIYADMGDVLELSVGWSCGNPFYYGYGFHIDVVDTDGEEGPDGEE